MSEGKWYPSANDRSVLGKFDFLDVEDLAASRAADEKIYKRFTVLYERSINGNEVGCRKMRPGEQNQHIERFPDAWAAFKGSAPKAEGIGLEVLGLSENEITRFNLSGIESVEQMALLSDEGCRNLGFGMITLRKKAIEILAEKKASALAAAIAASAPISEPIKRRGRPPKVVQATAAA